MRGVPEGRGESDRSANSPKCGNRRTWYCILPPGLRCAWPSPLVNEGGKGFSLYFSFFHSETASSSQQLFLGLEAWPLTQW